MQTDNGIDQLPKDKGDVGLEDCHVLPRQRLHLKEIDREGWILDLGGGGEGVIGKVKGRQVIAVDTSADELEETSNDSLKIVMDIRDLKFLDESFDTVTSFFTLMYLPKRDWDLVFSEVERVLRPGGEFWIWDANLQIPAKCTREFIVIMLAIVLPNGTRVETGYGCKMHRQSLADIAELAGDGLEILDSEVDGNAFHLRIRKEA